MADLLEPPPAGLPGLGGRWRSGQAAGRAGGFGNRGTVPPLASIPGERDQPAAVARPKWPGIPGSGPPCCPRRSRAAFAAAGLRLSQDALPHHPFALSPSGRSACTLTQLAALVYRLLGRSDAEYARFLHDEGYR